MPYAAVGSLVAIREMKPGSLFYWSGRLGMGRLAIRTAGIEGTDPHFVPLQKIGEEPTILLRVSDAERAGRPQYGLVDTDTRIVCDISEYSGDIWEQAVAGNLIIAGSGSYIVANFPSRHDIDMIFIDIASGALRPSLDEPLSVFTRWAVERPSEPGKIIFHGGPAAEAADQSRKP